jgi:hypothetical protein
MHALAKRILPMKPGEFYPVSVFIGIVALLLALSGCSGIPISYYDATTYTHLTELKAETVILVESFDIKQVKENEKKIEEVTLSLRKGYEYEFGKGTPNSDTTKQFNKIIGLFNDDVREYRENGPKSLGDKYFSEAAVVLGQAFDIAIATENEKNKDKW